MRRLAGFARVKHKLAAENPHRLIRCQDVNVISLNRHSIGNFHDRNFGEAGKNFRQGAGMIGIEVREKHVSDSRIPTQVRH